MNAARDRRRRRTDRFTLSPYWSDVTAGAERPDDAVHLPFSQTAIAAGSNAHPITGQFGERVHVFA
jgi:hypothetical protein